MTSPAGKKKKKKRKAQGWSFTFRPALSHTHLLAETNFLVLVLRLSMWRECVCACALGRRPKMEKTRPLFFLTRGQNKIDWNFYFVSVSFHSQSRRKKVEKMFRVSGQFCRRRWTNKREKVYGPKGEIGQFANCAINKFVNFWIFSIFTWDDRPSSWKRWTAAGGTFALSFLESKMFRPGSGGEKKIPSGIISKKEKIQENPGRIGKSKKKK